MINKIFTGNVFYFINAEYNGYFADTRGTISMILSWYYVTMLLPAKWPLMTGESPSIINIMNELV